MGTVEKHLFVLVMLIFSLATIGCVGAILYWAATNILQAFLVGLAIAAIVGVVHLIVRFIDWDEEF